MPAPTDAGRNYYHPAGTTFAYNTDGTTWLTVANVQSVKAPGIAFKKSDSTPLSATAVTSTPGMRDEPEWKAKLFLTSAAYITLMGLVTAKTYCNFRVQAPLILAEATNHTWTWSGYFLSIEPSQMERSSDDKIAYELGGNAAQGTATATASA